MVLACGCTLVVKKVANVVTDGVIPMVIVFKVVSNVQYHHHAVAKMKSIPTAPDPVAKPIAIAGRVITNTAMKVALVPLVSSE